MPHSNWLFKSGNSQKYSLGCTVKVFIGKIKQDLGSLDARTKRYSTGPWPSWDNTPGTQSAFFHHAILIGKWEAGQFNFFGHRADKAQVSQNLSPLHTTLLQFYPTVFYSITGDSRPDHITSLLLQLFAAARVRWKSIIKKGFAQRYRIN